MYFDHYFGAKKRNQHDRPPTDHFSKVASVILESKRAATLIVTIFLDHYV